MPDIVRRVSVLYAFGRVNDYGVFAQMGEHPHDDPAIDVGRNDHDEQTACPCHFLQRIVGAHAFMKAVVREDR